MTRGVPFPHEFRMEAVRTYWASGRSLTAVAQELGVSTDALSRWVRQARIDGIEVARLASPEREELHRLRRENQTLREEREMLRNAVLYFARETERMQDGTEGP